MVRSLTRISHSSGDVILGSIRRERNIAFDRHWKMPYRWNVYGPPGPVEKHKWLMERVPEEIKIVKSLEEPFNILRLRESLG
jgi:TPP-dependent indolepyruvate ferredoxin oxidoreductase alpha subunit